MISASQSPHFSAFKRVKAVLRKGLTLSFSPQKLRLLPLIFTVVGGVSLTTFSYILVEKWEDEKVSLTLEKQASAHVKALRQSLFVLRNNMESIKKLYELKGELSHSVFQTFLGRGMNKQAGVQAVEWIGLVRDEDRPDRVHEMRRQGVFDFMIRDFNNSFRMADARDYYYPILYTAPEDLNGHNLGVDLNASAVFKAAMDTARLKKVSSISDAVPIIGNQDGRYQVRLFVPVFAPASDQLTAFVAGLIYIDDLVENVLGDPEQSNKFHLAIFEREGKQEERQIYSSDWRHKLPEDQKQSGVSWSEDVILAQKVWRLEFTGNLDGSGSGYASIMVLFSGLLTTFVLMWYLWRSYSHMQRVERLVADRTESLFEANRSLRKEIAERRKAEEKLFHSAYHDTLTNCLNRRAFNENLHLRFEEARTKNDWTFACLFIDLDRLKYVNDTFGHEAGDSVIVETANRIAAEVRASDRVARLGGDEFAIILENVEALEQAVEAANRVLGSLRKPFIVNNEEFLTSGSVGVALAHDLYEHPEDLLRDSDTAMYHAKSSGRNQHAIFTEEMHQRALRDVRLQADLNEALLSDQFFLMYQPIFNLETGALYGFEALIRWQHPLMGVVPPIDFIALSEELGLIHDVGNWVIKEALKALSEIHQQSGCETLHMNINVSPLQVLKPYLVDCLKDTLAHYDLDPSVCQIEFTERALGTSAEEMALYLQDLKKLGVRILVDDFGTEHASLNHLNLFPIDGLKIDKSFITDMETDLTKRRLVQTIIDLKDILDLSITAEGIENTHQKEILQKMDCDFIQGYLCGRPAHFADVLSALQQGEITLAHPLSVSQTSAPN